MLRRPLLLAGGLLALALLTGAPTRGHARPVGLDVARQLENAAGQITVSYRGGRGYRWYRPDYYPGYRYGPGYGSYYGPYPGYRWGYQYQYGWNVNPVPVIPRYGIYPSPFRAFPHTNYGRGFYYGY